MTVYVDKAFIPFKGMKMCHMLADTEEELHELAARIGLRREWFQPRSSPHYDICKEKRQQAILAGAIEIDGERLVEILRSRISRRKT